MSKESPPYEDFISDPTDVMKFLGKDQMRLMEEYMDIMRMVSQKPMTVKEIHAHTWDPKTKKHSKTIKTVYRHLDILEEAGLVKVTGHRKPTNSRLTEKLYARSAKVFFLEEKDREEYWWETKEGEAELDLQTSIVLEYFDVPKQNAPKFKTLLKEYHEGWNAIVMDLFNKTQSSEIISDIFGKAGISQIKSYAGFVGTLGVFSKNPELLDKLLKAIQTK
jgi:DNA-binding transcriptional ArsR family regulator